MSGFTNISVVKGGVRVPVEPGGPAGGDLTGSYKDPVVKQIQQYPIDPRSPANGDTLIFNGGEWIPTPSPTSTTYFQGVWDASVMPGGSPDIANFPGLSDGFVWIVATGGSATVGGITGWIVGDYAIYSGGDWYKLSASSFGWLLQGNNGTNPTVNFIGTADPHDLSIRANSIEGLRIYTDGKVQAANDLTVVGNITGTNVETTGDLAVNGGDITTTSATFNLLAGASTALNIGNAVATNTFSGVTKFPQGISGSLTRLSDGAPAFIQGVGILVTSTSNGPVVVTMSNTGSAGTYGNSSQVPVFTTDAQGRITAVTNTPIAIAASQVVSGTFPSSVSVQNIYQNVTSQVSGGSSALVYGEVIYFTNGGGSAANPAVDRASAASSSTSATTIGLVSSATIPNAATGQIIVKGVLVGNPLGTPPYLNTNGFTQGDLLYVDATTPGALTNVRPSYPNYAIPVGIVIVKNQYTGAIYVDPSIGLNDAEKVKIPAATSKRTEPAPTTTSIPTTWFNGPPAVSYLALDFSGSGNVTLTTPIQAQTTSDYGRDLWIHNVSTKTITFKAGGTALLAGGADLVLPASAIVHFMWSFIGGGAGRWIQMGAALTIG